MTNLSVMAVGTVTVNKAETEEEVAEALITSGAMATEIRMAKILMLDETVREEGAMSQHGVETMIDVGQRHPILRKTLADEIGEKEIKMGDEGQNEIGTGAANPGVNRSGWTSLRLRRRSRLILKRISSGGKRK